MVSIAIDRSIEFTICAISFVLTNSSRVASSASPDRSDDFDSQAGALVCRRVSGSSHAGRAVACNFINKFDFRLIHVMDHFAADMFNYKKRVNI